MIDLSKLTPGNWFYRDGIGGDFVLSYPDGTTILQDKTKTSREIFEFIAMAHNAFQGDPDALTWWEENRRKP